MNSEIAMSAVALIVSTSVALIAYAFTRANSDRPILVFTLHSGKRWHVDNVGNGPALNILVADLAADGATQKIVNCAPVPAGGRFGVPWLQGGHELVAIYSDVHNRHFTTVCGSNRNRFARRNLYPKMKANRDQWIEDPVFEGRHEVRITERELSNLTPLELLLLRNSIYAKHGYIFPTPDFRAFFERDPNYTPRDANSERIEAKFTLGERAETHMILGMYYRHPQRYSGPYQELLDPNNQIRVPALLADRKKPVGVT